MTSQEAQPFILKILQYLEDNSHSNEYHNFQTICDLLSIPKNYRTIILDEMWYASPKYIDAISGLNNAKIKINKHGIAYLNKMSDGKSLLADKQKEMIVQLCSETIEKLHKVRIGWASEQILQTPPKLEVIKTISLALQESGKYLSLPDANYPGDFEVIRNPSFKEPNWTQKYPIRYDIFKGAITAGFAILVSLLLGKSGSQENTQWHKQQEMRLDSLTQLVDSLTRVKTF